MFNDDIRPPRERIDSEMRHRLFVSQSTAKKAAPARPAGQTSAPQPPARPLGQTSAPPPSARPAIYAPLRQAPPTAAAPVFRPPTTARTAAENPAAAASGISPDILDAVAASTVFPAAKQAENQERRSETGIPSGTATPSGTAVQSGAAVSGSESDKAARAVMVASEIEQIPDHTEGTSWGLLNYPLGSLYAPLQSWRNILGLSEGFTRGTIFEELFLPFKGESIYKGGAN